ncbi:serine-rich adhesin for platelets isoform X2 [Uranotaenia lowii]|uniref:serine-rich adhesin for platelets isoform X2 n=1 Tax=Uranotaenia lowii TaxID=190385 RepID=UPI002478DBCE|nr:serine-rich adhesin for platelets isoform X2 [Uranotaenia lowii]
MDSMKRSEASRSHHQNKVVLTNQETDSNNKVNLSGSNLNNNTVGNKQQHQSASLNLNQAPSGHASLAPNTSGASDINKDSNFEYDDNEWDVGIGDLIIDLDADIEKSSFGNLQSSGTSFQASSTNPSSTSTSQPLTTLTSTLDTLEDDRKKVAPKKISNETIKEFETLDTLPIRSNISTNISKIEASTITALKEENIKTSSSRHHLSSPSGSSSVSQFVSGLHNHHKPSIGQDSSNRTASNLSKHSVLLSQLNSGKQLKASSLEASILKQQYSCSTDNNSDSSNSSNNSGPDLDLAKSSISSSSSTMSSATSSSGGKSATKLSVDHQATLDKGLKMKIKRTKPGTKTSEAKHEIVKAEQNGTGSLSSSSMDENNSNSNSGSNSSNKKHSSQSQTQQQLSVNANLSQQQQQQQGTKRGSSGHRRDKTKEKTTHHNQRDKNDHNSSSTSGTIGVDRGCSCTHEMQVNGNHQPCSSISCVRSRTSDQSISSLTQRISNQNNSSTSTSNSLFSSNTSTGSTLSNNSSSSSNTPNAPGPPSSKDSKLSSAATSSNSQLSNLQHSTSSNGSGNSGSGNNNPNSGSSSSSNSSGSSNIALKSQLQMSNPPSNLLNALSSGSLTSTLSSSSGLSSGSSMQSTIGDTSITDLKEEKEDSSPPPAKRQKCDPKDMVDVCVGTSIGTITEPDCLGPCEPGTSVTLEGIVWHETEGGVLVVNVTWRGKTYVGTLIDCTKHDWAPPRFCDSPTEELDSRTLKGRAKRGRNSGLFPMNDLSNFTETRSSMHSKLRNGATKGRGGRTTTAESSSSKTTTTTTTTTASSSVSTSTSVSSNTPSTSPVAFLPPRSEKRKSKDEPPSPVNIGNGSSNNTSGSTQAPSSSTSTSTSNLSNNGPQGTTQNVVNPMTGLNVQISTKKCKSASSPCAVSPVLLECPEQDCSKKYKHANGLRYHQSHAHGSVSSMDEDSSHPPESPQRVAAPATPPPTCSTTSQTTVQTTTTSTSTNSSALSSESNMITSENSSSQVLVSIAVVPGISDSISTGTTTVTTSSSTTTTSLLMAATESNSLPTSSVVSQSSNSQTPITSLSTASGSITTGIAGQSQLNPMAVVGDNPSLVSTAYPNNGNCTTINTQPTVPPQSQPPLVSTPGSTPGTPTRSGDQSAKGKPGVLRFGPLPIDGSDTNIRLPTAAQGVPNTPGSVVPISQGTPIRIPTSAGGSLLGMSPNATPGTPEALTPKSQSCTKQKKNRKSPGPPEFDIAASNRAEDVQSPAYSDISDDSTPVVDVNDLEKSKVPPLPDGSKKPNETVPNQMGPLSSYGMFPYYPGMPHQPPYFSAEHQQSKPPGLGHSPLGPNSTAMDYKSKEPPIDLMNKPNPQQQQQQQQQQPQALPPGQTSSHPQQQQLPPGEPSGQQPKDGPPGAPPGHPGAGKMMQHFYPYGYMPTGFGYNLDPNYGPVSMLSEEGKHVQQVPGQMKEERLKESPSPNEFAKMAPQMVPTKMIKAEPLVVKDIKTESIHSMHPKDQPGPPLGQQQQQTQPGQPPISAYSGLYRHGLNVGPPTQQPPHMNREEDLRRLFNYPDQRRTSTSSNSSTSNINSKDEPPSPSQQNPNSSHTQPPNQSLNSSQQKSSKGLSSSQSAIKQSKDIKVEDKELLKVKQEGQKPTMETQGPPPPPTSQYYPHSLYMSAGPFGFDPNHQMYRNMLVPAASYSTPPYHLQIPRYNTPEDLSRNPNTKALDLLQHHASQYYNSHKIHELREGALKSPTSSVKVSVSSPNLSQQPTSQNPGMCIPPSNPGAGLPMPQSQQGPPSSHSSQGPPPTGPPHTPSQAGGPNPGGGLGSGGSGGGPSIVPPDMQKEPGGPNMMSQGPTPPGGGAPSQQPGQPPSGARSPPPQRHVHTHHHTHVGLGYPMFQAPYGGM